VLGNGAPMVNGRYADTMNSNTHSIQGPFHPRASNINILQVEC